ncbi:Arachidonate 15-lipoxygenase, partial [Galemys pyrenaicus]
CKKLGPPASGLAAVGWRYATPHPTPRRAPRGGVRGSYLLRTLFLPLARRTTSLGKMGVYRIRVSTGCSFYAGSSNPVRLWLVGQHGEAKLGTRLRPARGKETEFQEDVKEYLGQLLFVKVRKKRLLQDDAWFCNWISVQGPGTNGEELRFPCYRWVESDGFLSLPEGTGELEGVVKRSRAQVLLGCTIVEDTEGLFRKHREEELQERRKRYRWGNWKDGLILKMSGDTKEDLPIDERFLEDKRIDFEASLAKGLADLAIKDSLNVLTRWDNLDDFKRIFWCGHSKLAVEMVWWGEERPGAQISYYALQLPSSVRVRDSWKDDAFFGYQFLNGANPMLLRRSCQLPPRLVFPPGMEELQAQLQEELQAGTLFEADFALLNGIKANVILYCQQHLAAPLVMLKLQPDGNLLPMVIQVRGPRTSPPRGVAPSI